MEAQPLAELRRVGVGLGGQTLRLEFTGDCSSYTLVARDAEKVCLFSELLSGQYFSFFGNDGNDSSGNSNDDDDDELVISAFGWSHTSDLEVCTSVATQPS